MNTQIIEMALATIAGILFVTLTYITAKFILHFTLMKIREENDMLYDLLDERDEELNRYHRIFGPLKDWEDSEWTERIEERYKEVEPSEDDDLPF